jgi:hypothetical protein
VIDSTMQEETSMKKLGVSMLLFLMLAIPCASVAQQAENSDVPDKADVLKFLDLMHTRSQMVQTLANMSKQMKLGAEDGFKQKVPDATPEQLAKVDQLFDNLFSSLPIDEMMDAIVPIYQRHLTKSDLAAMTAFYSSPVGQKVLKELPAIVAESMQAGGEIGRKVFAEKSQQFDQQVTELVKQQPKQQ